MNGPRDEGTTASGWDELKTPKDERTTAALGRRTMKGKMEEGRSLISFAGKREDVKNEGRRTTASLGRPLR